MSGDPKGGFMLNFGLSPKTPIWGMEFSKNETYVVSTRWRISKNWVSSMMLPPSTEPVVANFYVPSDFFEEGQVSGLRTVHPLLIMNAFSK